MTFGLYIKQRREARKITRKVLAEAAGIAVSTIGGIERGAIKRPPMKRVKAFAVVLEVHIDHLTAFFVDGVADPLDYRAGVPVLPWFNNTLRVLHVVMFSGGKDSTCMADLMQCLGMKIDKVLCGDLGAEWPQMYEHWKLFESLTGLDITYAKTKYSFFEYFAEYQMKRGQRAGQYGMGWCGKLRWGTSTKQRAIKKALKEFSSNAHVVEYHGISAEETHRLKRCDDGRDIKRPLVDWGITGKQALSWCYDQGYYWGGLYEHLDRVSCWCCENKNLKELKWMYESQPEIWKRLKQMDEICPFPYKGVGVSKIERKLTKEVGHD